MRETTQHDRAMAAFGQSLAAEKWAVECNKVGLKLRETRLNAFEARESGAFGALESHEMYIESLMRQWEALKARGIEGQFTP
jgi:hypothetical protein